MNQQIRNWAWSTSGALLDEPASRVLTQPESNLLSDSGLLATLARAWFDRKAEERGRKIELPELTNRRTQILRTEAPALETLQVVKPRTLQLDAVRKPQPTFVPLQEWEGYVVAVTDSHVLANLVDLSSDATRPNEQAEIPLQEFSDDDISKLSVGKVFRWAIGYQRLPTGQKMRSSQIIVRELPRWSRRELAEAKEEARELHSFLNRE
jgi:hypothetical protein